jgi:hypothetical protein
LPLLRQRRGDGAPVLAGDPPAADRLQGDVVGTRVEVLAGGDGDLPGALDIGVEDVGQLGGEQRAGPEPLAGVGGVGGRYEVGDRAAAALAV